MTRDKQIIKSLFDRAGVSINGTKPYDPQIKNEDFYSRVLRGGSLGLGEAYMDAWWDCVELDEFFHKILRANLGQEVKNNWKILFEVVLSLVLNPGRKSRSFEIGERHYDIGNDLYRAMLDKRLTYTCGYWRDAKNLDEAQEAKLDLVCRKIGLEPEDKVLDIGSGWGSFMGYAAEKYGAIATGVTVSKEQKALADELYSDFKVETRLQDYRDINDQFDHVVSLGMFEHVGIENYRTFMKIAHRALKTDGLFLLHTIGSNVSEKVNDPWIKKYIFPQGILPSIRQIAKSIEGLFVMEDWHNLNTDYDKTLMAWHENFKNNWDKIKSKYNDRFYRMWTYYLLCCAGGFRSRNIQLWQIVLSKKGLPGGYKSLR